MAMIFRNYISQFDLRLDALAHGAVRATRGKGDLESEVIGQFLVFDDWGLFKHNIPTEEILTQVGRSFSVFLSEKL